MSAAILGFHHHFFYRPAISQGEGALCTRFFRGNTAPPNCRVKIGGLTRVVEAANRST